VSEKKDLYKLAERYSHYLKDDLAYMPVDANGKQAYALIFGQFESETKASAKLSRMPRYIERQSPSVHQMGTIQEYISNNK
jgi:hypothetical protein